MKRGKRLSAEARADAARRILAGQTTIEAVCAETGVERTTVRSWMTHLERITRDPIHDRIRDALNVLYWTDDKRHAELVEKIEKLVEDDRLELERRREENAQRHRLAMEREHVRLNGRAALAVIDGGLAR